MKMKPVDFRYSSYAEYNVDSNAKDRRFKTGNNVRISKYKNIFAECYTPNWFEEVIVPWTYVVSDLNVARILERIVYEKRLQKRNEEKYRIKKVIKKKGDTIYVKWIDYNNSFNSYNHVHNILRVFEVLLKFFFTTSDRMGNYYL